MHALIGYAPVMPFDLGIAMRKKEEFESARLMDFEFRLRARAARSLASSLDVDEAAAVALVVAVPDDEMVDRFAQLAAKPVDVVRLEYQRCVVEARARLVAERGDPTPHRLA
jgi:hypothetical protein